VRGRKPLIALVFFLPTGRAARIPTEPLGAALKFLVGNRARAAATQAATCCAARDARRAARGHSREGSAAMTIDIDLSGAQFALVTIQPYPLPVLGGPGMPATAGTLVDEAPPCNAHPLACTPLAGDGGGAAVHLREGQPYGPLLGQRLIDASAGELQWAQDGCGDWWIVNRDDRDDVERAWRCGQAWNGPGVKALDSCMRGYPVGAGDAQMLNDLATPLCGDSPRARQPLRPGLDRWSDDLLSLLCNLSGGRLSVMDDAHGNRWLVDSRDRAAFERENCGCDRVHAQAPRARENLLDELIVHAQDVMWINRRVRA
jgi:hypothetical protein